MRANQKLQMTKSAAFAGNAALAGRRCAVFCHGGRNPVRPAVRDRAHPRFRAGALQVVFQGELQGFCV